MLLLRYNLLVMNSKPVSKEETAAAAAIWKDLIHRIFKQMQQDSEQFVSKVAICFSLLSSNKKDDMF